METETVAIVARYFERLLIVLAGALSIVLGYRTFLAIPRPEAGETGEGKLELPGGVSIYVTRVGPGVFFALFGAVILAMGMRHGLSLETREQRSSAPPGAPSSGADPAAGASGRAPVVTVLEHRLSSAAPEWVSPEQRTAARTDALGTVGQLGRIAAAFEGEVGRGLPTESRTDFGLALADARKRILVSIWDEPAWGTYIDFDRWVQEGRNGPPPRRAAAVAAAYQGPK